MRRFRGTLLCLVGALGLIAAACQPQPTDPGNAAPVAVIAASPDSGDAPLLVTFSADGSADSDGAIVEWEWDFGDGSAVQSNTAGDDVTHEYTVEGTHTAKLTVVDDGGAASSATVEISVGAVNQPPTVAISADPSSGKAPLTVTFTGSASTDVDGTIESYEWDFGDGGATSTEADPTHVYADPGLYAAQLTVTDDDGATATDTVTIEVVANQAPAAVASGTPLVGKFPLPVQFTGSGSTDADGTIASYSWDFGDGSPLNAEADPAHTYATAGDYTATLTVTDDSGDTATATVAVTVNPNQPPVAVANANPSSGQAPLTVAFSSADSTDPDGTIVSRSWDFGDDTFSTATNPTHTYGAAGTYTATLTVTDDNGDTGTAQVTIVVSPIPNEPPTAVASGTNTTGKEPLTVTFSSVGSSDPEGSALTYAWDFGDGGSSTQANPSHTYTSAGNYVATLTVKDTANATATATVAVEVIANQAPTAVASGSPLTGKEDLTVTFSSADSTDADGTITSRSWDFGDGGSSTQANPSHTYTMPGTFTATLTVTDDNGATASDTVAITVIANQAPVAAANATPQNGPRPLVVTFNSDSSTDPDGAIVAHSWNFGDGSPTSSVPNPSHSYATNGTFTATLTVTDDNGVTDTDSVLITVVIDDDGDGVSPPADCDDSDENIHPGAPDVLGDNVDSNCDGGDGVVAEIIHVRSSGATDSTSCGSTTDPCATITFGQTRATSTGRDTLVVAGGTYARFSVVNGLDVRGGFGQNFLRGFAATGSTTTTVNGSYDAGFGASAAIIANGINTPTLVSDLRAVGANESANARASYGVIVRNSTGALTMDTLTVIGGTGGTGEAGSNGANASQTPAPGGGGGQDGDDPLSACNTERKSGGGGASGAGNGGAGGSQDTHCGSLGWPPQLPNLNATPGLSGSNASTIGTGCGRGGGGGQANTTNPSRDGGAGQPGCESHGSGGNAGGVTNGTISGGLWTRTGGTGGTGTLGNNGTGGGGGGGGGANDDGLNNDDRGGGGGGGGAGGARATAAGTGGGAGHASIAVLVTGSSANLVNFDVTLGNGGTGGQGGVGGLGQPGGPGGSGGARIDVGGAGGNGGNGGRGGHAGAGGGGAGGPSYGIVTSGSPVTITGASFTGGSGGSGGAGGTNGVNGATGQTGPRTNTINL